jgi:3-oxoadipate enol-lactonase
MTNTQNAVTLHYEERGEGMPVVLLHGFPFDHTIWAAQLAALSDGYRVIAPDLRGHGHSPAPEGLYDMDIMASDVVKLLDDLDIEQAVWVGHSMGGYITLAGLRRAISRIRAVAFVATHPRPDSPDKRIQRLQSADLALQNGPRDIALSMMGVLFAPEVDRKSPLAQRIYDIMASTPAHGVAGALRGMAERPASLLTIQRLQKPSVIIGGAEDQIVTPDTADWMATEIPDTELVLIDGAGHLPMVEQPDATTEALRTFFVKI